MNDRMRVIGEGHDDVEDGLEIGLSRKSPSINVYSTESCSAPCSTVRVTVIDYFFNKVIDLGAEEGGATETREPANSFAGG
jgi:hypothetical protein